MELLPKVIGVLKIKTEPIVIQVIPSAIHLPLQRIALKLRVFCPTQPITVMTSILSVSPGVLWRRGIRVEDQNLCTFFDVAPLDITPLNASSFARSFMPEVDAAYNASLQLRAQISWTCPKEGVLNALLAHLFLTHFRLDQRDRKSMMKAIYDKTLKVGKDLDGSDIFAGAKKVFFNNLSRANKESVRGEADYGLSEFNSYEGDDFHSVFKPLDVWPVLQVLYFSNNGNEPCKASIQPHYKIDFDHIKSKLSQDTPHILVGYLNGYQKYLFHFNEGNNAFHRRGSFTDDPMRNLVLGFFKERKKILYYGLKGKFQAKNPIFALSLSDIEFRGSAFAKAFGGRFGPQPEESDHLVLLANHNNARGHRIPNIIPGNVKLLQPNYSRWPGDKLGLIDIRLHDNSLSNPSNFLIKHDNYKDLSGSFYQRVYTIEAFFHLIFYNSTAFDDPLARLNNIPSPHHKTFMRMIELMAVYPDAYDLSYYSIAGNYMQTYFPKICKLLLNGHFCFLSERNKIPDGSNTYHIRGDFGWPETDSIITENKNKYGSSSSQKTDLSIAPYFLKGNTVYKVEIGHFILPPPLSFPGTVIPVSKLIRDQFFYPWLAQELPDHLLSSWAPPRQLNYETYEFPGNDVFLKCDGRALENMPVDSACVQGGRSGYSVKLISCDTVKGFPSDTRKPSDINTANEYCR